MVQPLCLYTVLGFEGVSSLQKLVDVCGETSVVVLGAGEPGWAYWLPHRAQCLVYPQQHLVTALAGTEMGLPPSGSPQINLLLPSREH